MEGIIRLLPTGSDGWVYFPTFESRVVAFNQRYLKEQGPSQLIHMVTTLRQRFINDPNSTGFWLAFKDNLAVGHVCAWITMDWNQPYVFIYQAETAPSFTKAWSEQLDEWVAEANGLLVARGGSPITFAEFATFNDPATMSRLLEMAGRTNLRSRSLLRFDV